MASDVLMSMSAHVTTMRQQDEQQKDYLNNSQKLIIRSVTCPYAMKTDSDAVTNQPES